MIKAKQIFFWTCKLKGHGFHGDKATIFYLTSEYYSLSVLSAKFYFLEIGPVHHKLWPFKYMTMKTLNSNFLDWEDTLSFASGIFKFRFTGKRKGLHVWNLDSKQNMWQAKC